MKFSKMLQAGVATFLVSGAAMAGSVDLSSWNTNGSNGNWTLQTDNNSVLQQANSLRPTFFHNNTDSQGLELSGEITVQTTSDNDFIGFVLGYNEGDHSNASADYVLIDWKQADQASGSEGLAISKVTGALQESGTHQHNAAWTHTGIVEELARATNLGSTGWNDNQTYSFDLIFTGSLIEVFVNDVKELSLIGVFNNGSFGFYNHSQTSVLYAGIDESVVPAVPVPASLFMFAPALFGLMGLSRKAKATIA